MRNIKLILSYDGTNFYGWQVQSNERTVQGVVEDCLNTILKERVRINGSGRTDAGVHALSQVANFRTERKIECESLLKGLNSILPKDVAVTTVVDAETDFDARRSASSRRYRYLIYNGAVVSPFSRNYAWHLYRSLNVDAIREAGTALLGVHDFSSFVGGKNETESTVRELMSLSVDRMSGDFISIEVKANAFLRHMVRNIVGTLVDVGWGKTGVDKMGEILEARDRGAAGITAPAVGLYLVEVEYL